jgi:AmmeMemoRadiSam system protein B
VAQSSLASSRILAEFCRSRVLITLRYTAAMPDTVRAPAVAGTFYPGSASELGATVDRLLAAVKVDASAPCPKALIVPHAGYVYSGPIAASAFARIMPFGDRITRVVLVGPAHRVYVEGLVSPGASRLCTPLGELAVDEAALATLQVAANPTAHAREHSLEVELPFLQRVTPNAKLVPLAGTRAKPEVVGAALEKLWGGPETLIVISSDLSHYLPYDDGRRIDTTTCARIVALDPTIAGEEACGSIGINGLLWVARQKKLRVELVDLRSSGDTAGSRDEVVGYGAFALYEVS